MSNNRFVFSGLDELRAELRQLPADLTGEASHIVEGAANGAAVAIRSAYPVRTTGLHPGPRRKTPWYAPGNLRDHVTVTHIDSGGRFSAGAIVKNTAKHAWIFENGTQARNTSLGANRGSMPPGHVFIPAIMRARRAMYVILKDLLVRKGLSVSGDA